MVWRNVKIRCGPRLCTAFRNAQIAKKLVTVQGSGPEEQCASSCPQGVYRITLLGEMLNYQVVSDFNGRRT